MYVHTHPLKPCAQTTQPSTLECSGFVCMPKSSGFVHAHAVTCKCTLQGIPASVRRTNYSFQARHLFVSRECVPGVSSSYSSQGGVRLDWLRAGLHNKNSVTHAAALHILWAAELSL